MLVCAGATTITRLIYQQMITNYFDMFFTWKKGRKCCLQLLKYGPFQDFLWACHIKLNIFWFLTDTNGESPQFWRNWDRHFSIFSDILQIRLDSLSPGVYYRRSDMSFNLGNNLQIYLNDNKVKGGVGKFKKPARDTLFVIFHGMLLTSR